MPALSRPASRARCTTRSRRRCNDQGAEDQFDAVVESFFELVRGSGPREAEVISAVQLAQAQQDAILRQLRGKYGAALDVKFVGGRDRSSAG